MTKLERDHEALRLRYKALSDDWNRQRDHEAEWNTFTRRVFWFGSGVALIAALCVIAGY